MTGTAEVWFTPTVTLNARACEMALQNHPAREFPQRAADTLDLFGQEADRGPKIMSVAHHPYLSGVGHRFGHVRQMWQDIVSRPGVAVWEGSHILERYRTQPGATQPAEGTAK